MDQWNLCNSATRLSYTSLNSERRGQALWDLATLYFFVQPVSNNSVDFMMKESPLCKSRTAASDRLHNVWLDQFKL